jgi:arylsulfatase A-like enzyme
LIAGGDVPSGRELDLIGHPIDILPTLCELAGVAVEPERALEGKSFAPAVLGGPPRHRDYTVSGCHVRPTGPEPPRRAVTPFLITDRWGYAPVGARGLPELYDLSVDPLAEDDVIAENGGLAAELHGLFLSHLSAHGAGEAFTSLWASPGEGGGGAWAIDYPDGAV